MFVARHQTRTLRYRTLRRNQEQRHARRGKTRGMRAACHAVLFPAEIVLKDLDAWRSFDMELLKSKAADRYTEIELLQPSKWDAISSRNVLSLGMRGMLKATGNVRP